MPAVGEQHRNTENPFDEPQPRISVYTAQELATLQSRLSKQLGPEYISARPGASGQKVHYITAEKCINLANEVFGFNGWSSAIQKIQVDFVDENTNTGKISLGLSVIVRVTLKDGTFHEDIGYGHIENCKGKAAAFEKAKKEGTTDALKRALRNFGNVLGNCIYDKDYLAKVTKVKVAPIKWDVENLHRHSDYAPMKREPTVEEAVTRASEQTSDASTAEFDDDWDGDAFNEADFSESHVGNPDEVSTATLPPTSYGARTSRPPDLPQNGFQTPSRPNSVQPANPQRLPQPALQAQNRAQSRMPPPPGASMTRGVQPPPQGPMNTPHTESSHSSSPGIDSQHFRPQSAIHTGTNPPRNLESVPKDSLPQNPPSAGFYSARTIDPSSITSDLPPAPAPGAQFNPHAESPSIRKTSGFDHRKSAPISKKILATDAGSSGPGTQSPLPGHAPKTQFSHPSAVPPRDFINPSMDMNRRIGAPSRPSVKRPPLNELSNTPAPPKPGGFSNGTVDDAKKRKIGNAAAGEN